MMKFKTSNRKGVSLTELMVSVAILGMIVVAVSPLFTISQRGFSSMEAHNSLKTGGQDAINKIGNKLSQCKRVFENSVNDQTFVACATLSSQPNVLTGTKIPVIEPIGTLSPATTGFVPASAGNALFFASIEAPVDVEVLDATGAGASVRIDYYMFNYFYLAEDSSSTVASTRKINLWEWHSKQFADYIQLMNITDVTKRNNTVMVLFASGTTTAWDPSALTANLGFYNLDNAGALTLNPNYLIPQDTAQPMIKLLTGVTMGGYRYGISPNTGTTIASGNPVPEFAPASGKFPSGFETIIIGPNSARQVFIRLVLLAQGSFKGFISSEQILLTTARDLW